MVSHQQARRNLTSGELIYANSMVAEEIALENKEKVSKAISESNKNRNSNSVHLDANETKTRDRSTNTREQVAKMSGVGAGTVIGTLAYDTKEVMRWMLDIQLGRRNLSPIQRIKVTEKYRPIYEKRALTNKQAAMQEARRNNEKNKSEQFSENSSTTVNDNKIDVRAKLAETAGVSTDTYSKVKKFLI